MPLHPTWPDIALRLALTLVAGGLIGLDREMRGHAAGFRTNILVCLAAAVAMIQCNILLSLGGKTAESFATMDLMRLPLGILTGVGFIGGGAILKRGDLVTGVTTAATLWVTTVIGLCFGGGQLVLGCAATVLVVATLWVLRSLDRHIPRTHRATVAIRTGLEVSLLSAFDALLARHGFRARLQRQIRDGGASATAVFEVHWTRPASTDAAMELLNLLESHYDVQSFRLADEADH
jgi:putative Mg2+ transporter-C (MgtC) family protein